MIISLLLATLAARKKSTYNGQSYRLGMIYILQPFYLIILAEGPMIFVFEHACICTVSAYAWLSVCPSMSLDQNSAWKIIYISESIVATIIFIANYT